MSNMWSELFEVLSAQKKKKKEKKKRTLLYTQHNKLNKSKPEYQVNRIEFRFKKKRKKERKK